MMSFVSKTHAGAVEVSAGDQVAELRHLKVLFQFGWLALLLVIALITGSQPVRAQSCTLSITPVAFGNIDVLANTNTNSTGTVVFSCTGIVSPNRVKICLSFDNGTYPLSGGLRQMGSGANRLLFQLYDDAAHTNVMNGSNNDIRFNVTQNNPSKSRTLYGLVPNGQQIVPVGSYSTSIIATARTEVHTGGGTASNCNSIPVWQTVPFSVTATVAASCSVTVTNMDFGTTSLFTTNIDTTSTVNVTCTNDAPYNIRLDGGTTGATDPTQRKITLGGGQITYGLYRDASRTLGWGSTDGSNTKAGTGTATADSHTVYGRIPPQAAVAPGTYTDTVIAVVSY